MDLKQLCKTAVAFIEFRFRFSENLTLRQFYLLHRFRLTVVITEILRRSLDQWNQLSIQPSQELDDPLFLVLTVSLSEKLCCSCRLYFMATFYRFSETWRLNTEVAAAKTTLTQGACYFLRLALYSRD